MLKADFEKYALILAKKNRVIYHSKKSHLEPLVACINQYKGHRRECTLYDRVVGLAAARLIVYSQMISYVSTPLATKNAQDLLEGNKIKLEAQDIAKHVLAQDQESICPLEIRAKKIKDNKAFFLEVKSLYSRVLV